MQLKSIVLASTLLLTGAVLTPPQNTAQASTFPDVPLDHWAFQAVQDLADKGLVKGYPDGKFLGNRALTRYEYATIIERLLATVADMKSGAAPTASVTQDDLNKIQVLVDEYHKELTDIKTDVSKAQSDITDLRGQIKDLRKDVNSAKDTAAKALDAANNSYGVGGNRKFQISGYIQARYYDIPNNNDQVRFPSGTAPSGSAYNGNYGQGSNSQSFVLRRSRLKFTGQVTQNTKYAIQVDASGLNSSSDTAGVSVREGNINYTPGSGDTGKNPTFTAGMFATPFGYELPSSTGNIISPERPLAFNEGSAGLFNKQDYERGFQISKPFGQFRLTGALVNGTGQSSNDTDTHIDQVYHASWQSKDKTIGLGASYYDGALPGSGVGLGSAGPPVVAPFAQGKRQLTGFDAQFVSPKGLFLNGEYLSGKYEQRSYFGSPITPKLTTTNPAHGNKVEGWYVQGGYTFKPLGAHPLTLAAGYDELDRSKSGVAASAPGGASGSSFDDVNVGYGALYGLDKATRLRLWYTQPNEVAHAAGTASPPKIGLFITEVQVKF